MLERITDDNGDELEHGQPDYPGQDRDVLAEVFAEMATRGWVNIPDGHSGATIRDVFLEAQGRLAPDPGAAPEVEGLRARLDDQLLGTVDWPDKTEDTVPVGLLRDLRAALRDTAPALDVVRAARDMRAARERKAMAGPDLREAIVAEQRLYLALDALEGASRDT